MVFTFSHPDCLISFCERCLDPIHLDVIIKESRERELYAVFFNSLNHQNYIRAYKGLWCMGKKRRLKVLRECEEGLHSPLMYEQAVAEFVSIPTIETLENISIPLIRAAGFRLLQDSKCSVDPSVCINDFDKRMERVYFERLDILTQMHLQRPLEEIMREDCKEIEEKAVKKVLEVAKRSIYQQLPPPHWINSSGLALLVDSESLCMLFGRECKVIRDRFAYKTIADIMENHVFCFLNMDTESKEPSNLSLL